MAERNSRNPGSRYWRKTVEAVLVAAVVILVNMVAAPVNLRWDVTADRIYSFSDGTLKILEKIRHPVTLRLFYSSHAIHLPLHLKNYARRVIDMLGEYQKAGAGKVKIEIYDPRPDSDVQEWAERFGIEGFNLPGGQKAYFGLTALAADQEETIPFLDPSREAHLEYDITRIISRVQSAERKTIAVVSALPVFGGPSAGFGAPPSLRQPWMFIQELRKSYTVLKVDPGRKELPSGTDLLLLFHPKAVSQELLESIDRFARGGGRILAFLDPVCLLDNPQTSMASSDLGGLLKKWGIGFDPKKIVADLDHPTQVRVSDSRSESNPLWISASGRAFNRHEPITGQLEEMLLPVAGSFKVDSRSGLKATDLIVSGKAAALVEGFKYGFDAETLRKDLKPNAGPLSLALKVSGRLPAEGSLTAGKEKAIKSAPATMVLVADADMLYDGYYVAKQNFMGYTITRVFNDNLNFLLNACELLTGSRDLVAIRSRGRFTRPFTKVEELAKKARQKWLNREQELARAAAEANRKLQQLERQKELARQTIISQAQQEEIRRFQEEKQRIDKELKIVRRNLRADIDNLGRMVKLINLVLMPLLVALAGIGYSLYQNRKAQRRDG